MIDHVMATSEVVDVPTLAAYIQQNLGTPMVTVKDKTILAKQVKTFFNEFPQADWMTLCRLVAWAKQKNLRPLRVYTPMSWINHAWKQGALPELTVTAEAALLEKTIQAALEVEEDDGWRLMLMMGKGGKRREFAEQWTKERGPQFGLGPKPLAEGRKPRAKKLALVEDAARLWEEGD